jgi:CSLREA domain-containing protein
MPICGCDLGRVIRKSHTAVREGIVFRIRLDGRKESLAPILTLGLSALGMIVPTPPAVATMIPVLTNSDVVANDGACSLREAITAGNTDTASGSSPGECPAGSGPDTITIPGMLITLTLGMLEISSAMEVVGSGVGNTVVEGGGPVFRVSAGQATLRGLTIRGGDGFGGGGVTVASGSTVEITDARITGNVAFSFGGGLAVLAGANVSVRRTTIDGNRAAQGAGSTTPVICSCTSL